jgi:hypothetical protein
MWSTLVLCSALSLTPNQGDLSLTHVRATHGILGPRRQSDSVYPGELYFLCFDIEGITADEDGKVRYSTAIEVSDSDGKRLFKKLPQNFETKLSLGGNRVPAYAHLSAGLESPAGEYGFKVTVKDLASGKEQSLSRTVKVLPRDFALVAAAVTIDVDAQYPVIAPACGQGAWIHCSAVGFERDPSSKQPNVVFEMRVLDEDGKAIFSKPTADSVTKDVGEKQSAVPMGFPLLLNRPGKFTVELRASDKVSGKKAKLSFPLTVQAPPQD